MNGRTAPLKHDDYYQYTLKGRILFSLLFCTYSRRVILLLFPAIWPPHLLLTAPRYILLLLLPPFSLCTDNALCLTPSSASPTPYMTNTHECTHTHTHTTYFALPYPFCHPSSPPGIVAHIGAIDRGHYYSFVKERATDKWIEFNDRSVLPFSAEVRTACVPLLTVLDALLLVLDWYCCWYCCWYWY